MTHYALYNRSKNRFYSVWKCPDKKNAWMLTIDYLDELNKKWSPTDKNFITAYLLTCRGFVVGIPGGKCHQRGTLELPFYGDLEYDMREGDEILVVETS